MTQALARPGMPRALLGASALIASASALAALVYVGTHDPAQGVRLVPDPATTPRVVASVGAALAAPAPHAVPEAAPAVAPSAAPAAHDADSGPASAAIRVPDLAGKRLSVAIREARALGLRVVARDPGGYRVWGSEARYYRVSRQTTEPGSNASEGDAVVVRVRSSGSYGEGY